MHFCFLVSIVSLQRLCNGILHAECLGILYLATTPAAALFCKLLLMWIITLNPRRLLSWRVFLKLRGFTICCNCILICAANTLLGAFFNSHVDSPLPLYYLLKCWFIQNSSHYDSVWVFRNWQLLWNGHFVHFIAMRLVAIECAGLSWVWNVWNFKW